MSVIAKKKSSKPAKKVSEAALRSMMEKALSEFQKATQERYDRAIQIYNEQDNETKDALDRMVDLLCRIARTEMWISASRNSSERMVQTLPDQVIRQNMTYMAVAILLDLAQMDVKVASFKFPKNLCASCMKDAKPQKKRRK